MKVKGIALARGAADYPLDNNRDNRQYSFASQGDIP
jgi:hypothetical protein